MPFVDLSSEKNQEYFGDGISEEVLNMLASIDQLNVTSRTTAFSLRGQ
jgi:TolB-like protein